MKKILIPFVVAFIGAFVSCSGGNSTAEQARQDSIRLANDRAEAERLRLEQEEQLRIQREQERADSIQREQEKADSIKRAQEAEREAKRWKGASSRSDLLNKLNGTTWVTTEKYALTGLLYKFEINGNSVYQYSAKPTHNYDDTKNWSNKFEFTISEIAEPKKGLFCVVCKAVDDSDARSAVPTILVFNGNTVFYSLGGDKGPYLEIED